MTTRYSVGFALGLLIGGLLWLVLGLRGVQIVGVALGVVVALAARFPRSAARSVLWWGGEFIFRGLATLRRCSGNCAAMLRRVRPRPISPR